MKSNSGETQSLLWLGAFTLSVIGIAIGLAISYWAWPRQFWGVLPIAVGKQERCAWRAADVTGSPRLVGDLGLSMSKDDLLSLNSSTDDRGLPSASRYDIAELPFSIGLSGVTGSEPPKVAGRLRVTFRGHVVEHDALPGTKIQVGKDEGEILEVRPWSGLISAPGGPAMTQISWADSSGEWKPGFVLVDDTWQALDAKTAVYFAWRASADEALASVQAGTSQLPQARWGVVDGKEVNWIGSLLPGSGLQLSDGTSVTLAEVSKDETSGDPCLVVDIVRAGKTEQRRIRADEPDPLIRFEDPAGHSRVFAVYGWAENRAEVVYLDSGTRVATGSLEVGGDWRPSPDGPAIRLDSVLEAAAYAAPGDSFLFEAAVRIPGRTFGVREKSRFHLGEAVLDFLANVTPAELDYALTVKRGEQQQSLVLRSGRSLSLSGWKLSILQSRTAADTKVLFIVTDERSKYVLYAGVLLTVLGGVGLLAVAIRTLRARKRSRSSVRE